ncbi:hypothetical protein M407DRAFT_245984 [Tulasnella calospora MUT 4182]|uniref:Uncharacterized protein n=1 Tax=Tulasnella calospora MUT 4182 TaxID=1051891 RepID=A0A0C3KEU5_9AGAM|nr:hypothetical protein M407DRAFT_245984 [Tulasnella calospora MUT 4182]
MNDETVQELRDVTGWADIVGFDENMGSESPEEWYGEGFDNSDEDSLGLTDLHDIFALLEQ